jgi:hypothetical protein
MEQSLVRLLDFQTVGKGEKNGLKFIKDFFLSFLQKCFFKLFKAASRSQKHLRYVNGQNATNQFRFCLL